MTFEVTPVAGGGRVHAGTRKSGAGLLMLLTAFTSGCYTTIPVNDAPVPGQVLVMDLNDRGRVALGPSIGPSATKVEGVLDSRTDSAYVIKVSSVVYMNGANNRWTNEPITIQSDLVRELRERKFSRSRTALVAGGTIGALVLFIASKSLLGLGSPDTDKGGGEGNQQ
jgi:hypothetical protein